MAADELVVHGAREHNLKDITVRLPRNALVCITGLSGSGKSSALRAGLVASLAADVLPGSAAWSVVVMRPGPHPLRELARAALGRGHVDVGEILSQLITAEEGDAGTRTVLVVGFIVVTTLAFLLVGAAPTTLLVFAGAFNGLLLPVGIAVLLWVATTRADLLHGYRYPRWLLVVGWAAWLLTLYLAVNSVRPVIELFG